MQLKLITAAMQYYFRQWFHKRNIIIVSERKVKHIPISGGMQFAALLVAAGSICWASYSTGSFMAARSALKERNQTLRSVASARVESLNPLAQIGPVATPMPPIQGEDPIASALSDPMFTPSALNNNRWFARVAVLENKVIELKNTNEEIIERVRDKTSGHISELESIIKQTGLNVSALKKQYGEGRPKAQGGPEGGPYIPDNLVEASPRVYEMFDNLDRLATLRQIISDLPLSMPIRNADTQSSFGRRIDPFTGHLAFHSGLDISGPAGTKIHSTADGKVIAAGRNGAYGNAIDIDHGYGIVTRYGHLSKILVKEGQSLKKGDVIGIQGSTGRSTGPHLHYEVRYNGKPMNPKKFLEAGHYVSKK